ncbi:hypothetical protein [Paraburkholderia sp. ZP32-5]|uniref:hypothetical protein n=1 Tax=Paraburkholderia sp. ZP32-5 TaxID=2883245 RepID=UPI001F1E537D|nr:hypothetical protein [Paraburkholderia sp. ZP32-5]
MSENKSKIFLLNESEPGLVLLTETAYEKEAHLQDYLARYPDLLPGDQIGSPARRWLFISRELGVPDSKDSGGKWSLDHLFLDQDGMPTFVECKRSTDTRGRREVVAQMLDYAANGVAYWTIDHITKAFEAGCTDKLPPDKLDEFLNQGDGLTYPTPDEFWQKVHENLVARRIRLIFVADKIQPELKRLVEFLNEEMLNVEVLAVEIRQYQRTGSSQRVLVPDLVGATTLARSVKDRSRLTRIDRDGFMARVSDAARPFYEDLFAALPKLGAVVELGTKGLSIRMQNPALGKLATVAYCYPPDEFQYYVDTTGLASDTERGTLRERVITESGGALVKTGQYMAKCNLNSMNRALVLRAALDAFMRVRDALAKLA